MECAVDSENGGSAQLKNSERRRQSSGAIYHCAPFADK
jgi:hypothetical protein